MIGYLTDDHTWISIELRKNVITSNNFSMNKSASTVFNNDGEIEDANIEKLRKKLQNELYLNTWCCGEEN